MKQALAFESSGTSLLYVDEGTGRFVVSCQECGAEEAAHTVSCADGELLLGEDCVEKLFAMCFNRHRKIDIFTGDKS